MNRYDYGCPCKECTERTSECHGKCQKYLEWKSTAQPVFDTNWKTEAHKKKESENILGGGNDTRRIHRKTRSKEDR